MHSTINTTRELPSEMEFCCLSCDNETSFDPLTDEILPIWKDCSACGATDGQARVCTQCETLVDDWRRNVCEEHERHTDDNYVNLVFECPSCGEQTCTEGEGTSHLSCDCHAGATGVCTVCGTRQIGSGRLACPSCRAQNTLANMSETAMIERSEKSSFEWVTRTELSEHTDGDRVVYNS